MVTFAYAETPAAAPQSSAPFMNFVPILGMLAIFYFFMIRPQQKKASQHKTMLEGLQKGDVVLTSGGIYGTVMSVGEKTFELKIAENVKIKILKSAVSDKLNTPEAINGKPTIQSEPKISS